MIVLLIIFSRQNVSLIKFKFKQPIELKSLFDGNRIVQNQLSEFQLQRTTQFQMCVSTKIFLVTTANVFLKFECCHSIRIKRITALDSNIAQGDLKIVKFKSKTTKLQGIKFLTHFFLIQPLLPHFFIATRKFGRYSREKSIFLFAISPPPTQPTE